MKRVLGYIAQFNDRNLWTNGTSDTKGTLDNINRGELWESAGEQVSQEESDRKIWLNQYFLSKDQGTLFFTILSEEGVPEMLPWSVCLDGEENQVCGFYPPDEVLSENEA